MNWYLFVAIAWAAWEFVAWLRAEYRAAKYRELWIAAERRREAQHALAQTEAAKHAQARVEVSEWIETAKILADENKTARATIAKLKQEVTELHEELDTRNTVERMAKGAIRLTDTGGVQYP